MAGELTWVQPTAAGGSRVHAARCRRRRRPSADVLRAHLTGSPAAAAPAQTSRLGPPSGHLTGEQSDGQLSGIGTGSTAGYLTTNDNWILDNRQRSASDRPRDCHVQRIRSHQTWDAGHRTPAHCPLGVRLGRRGITAHRETVLEFLIPTVCRPFACREIFLEFLLLTVLHFPFHPLPCSVVSRVLLRAPPAYCPPIPRLLPALCPPYTPSPLTLANRRAGFGSAALLGRQCRLFQRPLS